MELRIDPSDGSDGSDGSAGGDVSPDRVVENIERALDNPQIRGIVTAVMRNQGMDPSDFGIQADTEAPAMPEGDADGGADGDTLVAISSADDILEFIDQISAMSPLGDQTQLGTIRGHIESNKDDIESRLRNQ